MTTGVPTVSVVMPVRDGAATVEAAVRSVLDQSFRDLELVAVNDGSTDATPQILDRLAAEDNRLRIVPVPAVGLVRALVAGMTAARGRLVARQDADDVSLPGRLAAQAAVLDGDPAIALCGTAVEGVGPRGETLYVQRGPADSADATAALRASSAGAPVHGSVMFRRADYDAAGGYRTAFRLAEDTDLWLRLCERGLLHFAPAVGYRYTVTETSLTGRYRGLMDRLGALAYEAAARRARGESDAPVLDEVRAVAEGWPAAAPDVAAGSYFIGRCLVRRGDLRAWGYLWRSLRASPGRPGAWAGLVEVLLRRLVRPGAPA